MSWFAFTPVVLLLFLALGPAAVASPQPLPTEVRSVRTEISLIGREFTGDYAQSNVWLDAVKSDARAQGLAIDEHCAASIYLSDPDNTPPTSQRSFHGFVLAGANSAARLATKPPLELRTLARGDYVVAATRFAAQVGALYGEAYGFAATQQIALADSPPLLLTTLDDGQPVFRLYFAIARSP